jgi:hypothetical protein
MWELHNCWWLCLLGLQNAFGSVQQVCAFPNLRRMSVQVGGPVLRQLQALHLHYIGLGGYPCFLHKLRLPAAAVYTAAAVVQVREAPHQHQCAHLPLLPLP